MNRQYGVESKLRPRGSAPTGVQNSKRFFSFFLKRRIRKKNYFYFYFFKSKLRRWEESKSIRTPTRPESDTRQNWMINAAGSSRLLPGPQPFSVKQEAWSS
jgi:hypothetical protein